jgi:hypothetical protein
MNKRTALAVVLSFAVPTTLAIAEDAHPFCGTSAETLTVTRSLRDYGRLVAARLAKSSPRTHLRTSGDLIIVETDESTAPFGHRSDLADSTVRFQRSGTSGFRVRKGSLEFESEVGPLSRTFGDGDPNEFVHHALSFQLPFGTRTVRDLYISERFGIFLAPPPSEGVQQLAPLDAISVRGAVIAPYLMPNRPRTLRYASRDLFIRETSERLIVTWRSRYPDGWRLDPLNDAEMEVQAVLERNGDIRFNYRTLRNLDWGAVLLTTGEESSRNQTSLLGGANDPVGDAGGSPTYRSLLDLRRIDVHRVAGSELLKVRLSLGGRIYPNVVGNTVNLAVNFNGAGGSVPLNLSISPGRFRYCTPGGACATDGGTVEFTDDGVILSILTRQIPLSGAVDVQAVTFALGRSIDSASVSVQLTSGSSIERDLSSFASESEQALPILEAFTLPVLNPDAVWEVVRSELNLWDSEVDGLAIFQNFPTDIMQFATAYSTVGNSGADGVWAESEGSYGSDVERWPALLHMNRIISTDGSDGAHRFRHFLLGHEFGHRWLYGVTIRENGEDSWVLGPASGHPAQYVHTPAAFNVRTNRDYSVMGGSHFTDRGDGSFDTPVENGAWGYSWHELYLMGLASPGEVSPWYYIADSDPELGLAYNPPLALNVRGRRVDVSLGQLTQSMGARWPAAVDSQKQFRVLVVMLQEPSAVTAAEEQVLAETVESFPAYFSAATGQRGSVITSMPVVPSAAFTAPEVSYVGHTVAFRDASSDYPALWRWDFGDGVTSTNQFAQHTYLAPGTYRVRLTVENSRGSNTTERTIVIEQRERRRPLAR